MAKAQKSNRETRKQKAADAVPKTKVPRYMTGDGLSSAKPAPLKMAPPKK